MSEDDIATFLTSQTMVDGIVLATDTGSCPRQGANCCYIDNVKLLQDLIKKMPQASVQSYI